MLHGGEATAPKAFQKGTHRTIPPAQTVARVRPFLPVMGITRVANVTGLDAIGIPVVMVCRPNSRSLSVSQGKGLELAAAHASGLMESIELYHAEHIATPLLLGSHGELRHRHRLVDPTTLPQPATSHYHPNLPLLWIEGHDLLADEPTWVPFEAVHTNYVLPRPTGSGCFSTTSNGLASGNHLLEAISHATCEVVERDAATLWYLKDEAARDETRVDLDTVDDSDCQTALELYERAGVAVGVWETTTDIGIPAYLCMITERDEDGLRSMFSALGMGCHPTREIAMLRALTEAAQSRVTYISGARDDMYRHQYETYRDPSVVRTNRRLILDRAASRGFLDSPHFVSASLDEDVAWELERLQAAGITRLIVVDLTKTELQLPVVRVVIPGLEGPADHIPDYEYGPRGRAILETYNSSDSGS